MPHYPDRQIVASCGDVDQDKVVALPSDDELLSEAGALLANGIANEICQFPCDDQNDPTHRHTSSAKERMAVEFQESGIPYSD